MYPNIVPYNGPKYEARHEWNMPPGPQSHGQSYRGKSHRGARGENKKKFKPVLTQEKKDSGYGKFQNLLEHTKSKRSYKEPKNKRQDIWHVQGFSNNKSESEKPPITFTEVRDNAAGTSSDAQVVVTSVIDLTEDDDDGRHQYGTSSTQDVCNKENDSNNTVSNETFEVAKLVIQKIQGKDNNWVVQKATQANSGSPISSGSSNTDVPGSLCTIENNNSNQINSAISTTLNSATQTISKDIIQPSPLDSSNRYVSIDVLGSNLVIRASSLDRLNRESYSNSALPVTSVNTSLEPTVYCQAGHNSCSSSCCDMFSLSMRKETTEPVVNVENQLIVNREVYSDTDLDDDSSGISSEVSENDDLSSAEEENYGRYIRKKTSPPCKRKSQEKDSRTNLKKPKVMPKDNYKTDQLIGETNSANDIVEIIDIVDPKKRTYDIIEISDDEDVQMEIVSPALPTTKISESEKTNSNPRKQIKRENSGKGISTQKTDDTSVLPNTSVEHSYSLLETTNLNPQKVTKRKNSDAVITQQISKNCQSVDDLSTTISKHQKLSSTKTISSVHSKSLPVASKSQEITRQVISKQVLEPAVNSRDFSPKQIASSAITKSAPNVAATALPNLSLPSQQESSTVDKRNQSICSARKSAPFTLTKALPTAGLPSPQGSTVINLQDKLKQTTGFTRKNELLSVKKALPTSNSPSQQEGTAAHLKNKKKESTCSTRTNETIVDKKVLATSIIPSRQEGTTAHLNNKRKESTCSTKTNDAIVDKKALPTSNIPSQQEGKLKNRLPLHGMLNRIPVLMLKRLSPAEILKFSVPRKVADKSMQYQKDVLSQMKFFISFVYYSRSLKYEVSLASEVDDAKDLCNKMLHVYNRNHSSLIEFKYLKKQSDHEKINYKTLSSAEFDIKKIYQNFLEFRKTSKKLDRYSIYTNLDLSIEAFKNNGVKVELKNNSYYKLFVSKDHELHKKFLESLTLPKLAKLVIQCIEQGKQKNFNNGLIRKYHLALVKENIFIVQNKKGSNGKSGLVAKFHPNFIFQKGLSNAAKELYRLLSSKKPTKDMEFSIGGGFGKDIHFDPNPKLVDIKKVADALVYQEETKFLTLRSDLEKIMGHVLQKEKSDTFGFTKHFFLRGEDLPGDLKKLRWEIDVMLRHQNKKLYDFCQSKITIKDFCIDRPVEVLPDEDCEKLFDEFYQCFDFMKIQGSTLALDHDIARIDNEGCIEPLQAELLERIKKQELDVNSLDSIKNLASKCKLTSRLHEDLQPHMNIEFNSKVLEILEAQIPKNNVAVITTKNLPLLNLKIKQLYKESLFITNKTLMEMTHDVLNALAHRTTNFLVVQWSKPMKIDGEVLEVISQLLNRLQESLHVDIPMKSVIIIGDQESCSFLKNIIHHKIIDDEHSFGLSEDSIAKLLHNDNVFLQHRKLSLKPDLIMDEHVPALMENPEILHQLLTGKLTIGKDLTRPPCHKEMFFKPQIKQRIVINPQILHEDIDDVFIIRNIDRKDLQAYLPARQKILSPNDVPASMRINARYILLGFNIPTSFFDDYAEKNQERSIHLLRYESGSFVWENTKGNNKDLLRNRLDTTNDLNKSQKIEDVVRGGPMTVIICGESGSGKSVCLYTLAKETKHLYRDGPVDAYWPLQVNLDKARLGKFVEKALDMNMATQRDYVARFLCSYLELDEVQSKLLTMILRNQLKIKLVIFFDNYEELPASDRIFVNKLLQELQVSYCEKIYITSTPSTRSQLEEALGVFAYTLEFSEVEKMDFLQGFWSKNLGDVELINEAGNLIDNYSKTPSDDDLTSTPLQLKMLATMCQPDGEENYPAIESHVDLYKLFVEHNAVKDEECARIYSLNKLLDADQLKALNLQYTRKGFVYPDELRHSSFFEYFSAKYLASKNHSLAIANCINDLLDSVSSLFLKTYLAELNASEDMVKVVSDFATNGHFNVVQKMLVHCNIKLQLTPIIESDNPEARKVMRFLLDHYNINRDEIILHGELKNPKYAELEVVKYVNRKEKPKKETPLKVAARMKKIPIACELLLKGASIRGIDEEFVVEVAKYVADEMCKSESEWLHPIAEKLLKLQPRAVSHLDKTEQLPRLLAYFFKHGRVELLNILLKNDRERYNILEARVDDKSPLDLVNDSRVLSDDERLEITKYIVGNVGEDLERKNRHYLGDVLKTAAECNHERTFEYFVGKYPDRHMGFLQSAMRSNRLDLIRFLMRKTDRMMYPEENTALHKAVELAVSPMTINFLVNRGGIDNKNKAGETPLCVAFKEGHDLELIDYLIRKDAHLFAKDELGLYPWCYTILDESKYSAEEQSIIMKYLQEKETLKAPETEQKISFESDLKRKEVARKLKFFQKSESFHLQNLELHMALKSNDECWIKFLISHGASVNHKEADGRTPLHVAVEFKRYKLAKMLLDHGATFDAKDKKNVTPLKLLLKSADDSKESKEIRELLELATELFNGDEKYSVKVPRHLLNCRDVSGQTLLHVAAKTGNKMMIREMIKHSKDYCIAYKDFPSLDVNAKDDRGNTPMKFVKSNVDVAKELLVNGATFEPANTLILQSAERLIQAVKDKDVEKVKELIKTDCLVNARDHSGKSCLHWAANYDSREIVELLLAVRVLDVDAVDENSRTPLHYAAQNDNIATVLLLLKAGASYDMKDKQGLRPFDADEKNESLKLLSKIHEMFVDIKSDDSRILINENPDALIDYLAEIWKTWHVPKDIIVNVVDSKKNTLLHIATRYDFTSVVENLLKQGAIYNPKNKAKKTPESMAISSRWLFKSIAKAQQKLSLKSWMNVDPDIIVNVRFDRGYTLLYDCVARGKKEEVRWLIENGGDVRATNNRGCGMRCDRKKYPEIFEMIEEEMIL